MIHHRFIATLIVIVFLVLTLQIWAQGAGGSDEQAIQVSITGCAEALQNQDWAALETVCSSDWVHVTHMGDRLDMDGVKALFSDHITDHSIQTNNVDVHISADGSMAWATFNEETEYKFDGNPVKQKAVFTAIFEKEEDVWAMKLLHRSTAPPPADK